MMLDSNKIIDHFQMMYEQYDLEYREEQQDEVHRMELAQMATHYRLVVESIRDYLRNYN